MKKHLIITILIFVLLTCASCDNYRQYPSDNATRYPTLAEALDIDEDQIQYSFEDGNIVYVYYNNGSVLHIIHTYMDHLGYVKPSDIRDHHWEKDILYGNNECYTLSRDHYAGKYVITLDIASMNMTLTTSISDNLNSQFQYGEYIIESSTIKIKSYTYFLVLDEIPEDYEIYIDGVTYTVDQLTNGDLVMIIVFGTVFAIPIIIITIVTIKKIRKKKHKAKMDNIWGVR